MKRRTVGDEYADRANIVAVVLHQFPFKALAIWGPGEEFLRDCKNASVNRIWFSPSVARDAFNRHHFAGDKPRGTMARTAYV